MPNLFHSRSRTPDVRMLDLSDEEPADKFFGDDWARHEKLPGGVSSMGNAVLFTEGAAQYADRLRIDVDGLAGLLRDEGVTDEYMPTLAVVVHPSKPVSQGMKLAGWHNSSRSVVVESPRDNEAIWFSRAVHLVADEDEKYANHQMLHECGHLRSTALKMQGSIEYTPERVRSLRRKSLAGFAGFMAAEATFAYTAAEGVTPWLTVPSLVLTGLAAVATGVAAKWPAQVLWLRSSEEAIAEKFAIAHDSNQFITYEPEPVSLPYNHIVVPSADLMQLELVKLDDERTARFITPPTAHAA